MKRNCMRGHAFRALFILCLVGAIGEAASQATSQRPSGQREASARRNGFGGGHVSSEPSLKAVLWAPPDIDASVPPVLTGTPCALEDVVRGSGLRAKEWVANLERFTAIEQVEHQQFDRRGKPGAPQTRAFRYLVMIHPIRPGWFSVEESRDAGASLDRFPDRLATLGLPALALLFHPWHVDEFRLDCEGFSRWAGYPAWQVRFEQRPDRPLRMRSYRIGSMVYPVKLKGRAWIAANGYQVLHLDADLIEPIVKIRLQREHISVDYRPVQFQTEKLELWLPNRADVYFDFRGHRYHRRHSFSQYMLFSVDTSQQIREPGAP